MTKIPPLIQKEAASADRSTNIPDVATMVLSALLNHFDKLNPFFTQNLK